ncbi:MAG: ABC transporter permease subunit [Chloroflexi bacterium]|jgi:ABC-type transport system involved in multi-copper enzyme maturation permease subunit|nr:ABC transporter permease subunit [Chloroflexota bacterium]MBT7080968.1 ABC transporter permease subunit [Chloroflexota bacterium]MBT7290079.1 ABC transporter permease subunit [Chloroflexota bacterium]
MGFLLSFNKTFCDILGLKRNVTIVMLMVLAIVLYCFFKWSNEINVEEISPVALQTQFIADQIVFIWYIWCAGVLLAILVSAHAAGFISKEVTDGTLMLIVNKPINRYEIIIGKLAALIVNSIMLLAIGYLFSILLLWGILPLDMDSLQTLFGMMPSMILYAFLVALFFGSLSIAFSALMNSRIKIVMIAMTLIMYTFFFGVLVRFVVDKEGSNQYANLGLYSVDTGYHISNTFYLLSNDIEFWDISPTHQVFFGGYTGTYYMSGISGQDNQFGKVLYSNPTDYIHPAYSLFIVLGISAGAIGLAMWGLHRKEL